MYRSAESEQTVPSAGRHARPPFRLLFLFNLLQDVSVARPLILLATAEFDAEIVLLASAAFLKRDRAGVWRAELEALAAETGATFGIFDRPATALAWMAGRRGAVIAASESDLRAHDHVHDVFRATPPAFVRVTLQHGFECVGFLQNEDQLRVHGGEIGFAAEIVCGWMEADRLRHLLPSERPKLHVTGPPMALLARPLASAGFEEPMGLVCENLHSVRFGVATERRADFLETFEGFCAALEADGRRVALRPHPGGQYVLKTGTALPANALLENRPIYQVDLARFAYGISAPSTVIFDMLLAGVPVAVWRDAGATMDQSNYAGLPVVSALEDWLAFADRAVRDRDTLLADQRRFLDALGMPLDPSDVRRRFTILLDGLGAPRRPADGIETADRAGIGPLGWGDRLAIGTPDAPPVATAVPIASRVAEGPARILFLANGDLPSLHIFFTQPLAGLVARGRVVTETLTEAVLRDHLKAHKGSGADYMIGRIEAFDPAIIVACRYSGPHSAEILACARARATPYLFQIDDDLLAVPPEIGEKKYEVHNAPERLDSIRNQLAGADLVYCSTVPLRDAMAATGLPRAIVHGAIGCAGVPRRASPETDPVVIGYMGGGDHQADLALVVPAIALVLTRNAQVLFEIFGAFDVPEALLPFGERVRIVPPVKDYDAFLAAFEDLGWAIGLVPLAATPFNAKKTDIKWLEYTRIGAAVVAARGVVYDAACADGCGLLADGVEEWAAKIEALVRDPLARHAMVAAAQRKLIEIYSPERMTAQIVAILDRCAGRPLIDASPA